MVIYRLHISSHYDDSIHPYIYSLKKLIFFFQVHIHKFYRIMHQYNFNKDNCKEYIKLHYDKFLLQFHHNDNILW